MAWEMREGQGSLFRNEKATTDRHPSHTGTVLIGGVEMKIAAWVKEGKNGRFFSLKVEPKNAEYTKPAVGGPGDFQAPAPDTFDGDLPF